MNTFIIIALIVMLYAALGFLFVIFADMDKMIDAARDSNIRFIILFLLTGPAFWVTVGILYLNAWLKREE